MDISTNQSEETPDKLSSDDSFVAAWLDRIELAGKEEEDWRKDGDEVVGIYRNEDSADRDDFNILYSNVETTLPAVYNSTPIPDVRRRFNDRDPVAKAVSDILERSLSYSVDTYDFDAVMQCAVFDSLLPGRGVVRVRYVPYLDEAEEVAHEEVVCEYVPWRAFRRGPGRTWDEVPWIAFEQFLTREELRRLSPDLADEVSLDYSVSGKQDEENPDESDNLRRARVWEIWDKDAGEVVFIATGLKDEALLREPDPLGLTGFWPVPRPLQPIYTPGKITPVAPYKAYRKLADELNEVSRRITKIVRQIRVRGAFYAGASDLAALANADDGQLVPLESVGNLMDGGLENGVMWWPIEPQAKVLAQLVQQREMLKQTIYEVTGISDILRGQSEKGETATAQNIKNQWGSQRVQRLQKEIQRFARDIFRIKAEIMAEKFSLDTMLRITGVKVAPQADIERAKSMAQQAAQQQQPLPPQIADILDAQPREQIEEILKSDQLRSWRVDIETDSTVRADVTRSQEQMNMFLQTTSQYLAAVGPAVQSGQIDPETAVTIFNAFSRFFKLGKQVEDSLERLMEQSRKPQPKKPDPEQQKVELEKQKMQMQAQADERKSQLEMQKAQFDMQMQREKAQQEMTLAQQKAEFDMQIAQQKAQQDYNIKMMQAQADAEIKRHQAVQQAQIAQEQNAVKADLALRDADTKAEIAKKQAKAKQKAMAD